MGTGYDWANGSTLEFANGADDDRGGLIEKAYAELNARTGAPHGMELNSASDSYEGIAAGNASALTLLTGRSETGYALNPRNSASARLDHFDYRLGLEHGRRSSDIDADELERQSRRRPYVHDHRRQRRDRHVHDPESVEFRL